MWRKRENDEVVELEKTLSDTKRQEEESESPSNSPREEPPAPRKFSRRGLWHLVFCHCKMRGRSYWSRKKAAFMPAFRSFTVQDWAEIPLIWLPSIGEGSG